MVKVISLGSNCHPAFHIRRIFKDEEACFFDWLLTGENDLMRILRNPVNAFREMLQPDLFYYVDRGRKNYTVRNTLYRGIVWTHDSKWAMPEDVIPGIVSKYRVLAKRFVCHWMDMDTIYVRYAKRMHPAIEAAMKGRMLEKVYFGDSRLVKGVPWQEQNELWDGVLRPLL
jgi:hypothetical protein